MNATTSTGLNRRNNLRREITRLQDKARTAGLNRTELTRLQNLRRAAA